MSRWLQVVLLTLSCLYFIACQTAQRSLTSIGPIEVQGHRGARAIYPENSIPAFQYALEVGVDTIELDLGVTKDGVLVVTHDPYINPSLCLGPNGNRLEKKIPLGTLTAKEVKRFDCGSLKNPRFPKQITLPGTRIPTLKEVFAFIKTSKIANAKTVNFNIETKMRPDYKEWIPSPAQFAKLVVEVVEEYGMVSRVTIQSFDHRSLIEVRKLQPKIKIAALTSRMVPDYDAIANDLTADIFSPNHRWIEAGDVRELRGYNVKTIPWTANSQDEWRYLIEMGVDGIITDDPEALITFLKKEGLRSPR